MFPKWLKRFDKKIPGVEPSTPWDRTSPVVKRYGPAYISGFGPRINGQETIMVTIPLIKDTMDDGMVNAIQTEEMLEKKDDK